MKKVWLQHYNSNIPTEIHPEEYTSLIDVLEKSFHKYSQQTAFICMGQTLSYQQVNEMSLQFASFLQNDLKLKKGDRIALQMPNILQFPIALFGALRAGLTIVNTNPLYTTREMRHQFKDSGAKAIVILANFASKLQEVLSETSIQHVVITELGDLLGFPKSLVVNKVVKYIKKMVPQYELPEAIPFQKALELGSKSNLQSVFLQHEDLAFLQYTGGTTGVAKGAMLTHKNIISNMQQIVAWMDYYIDKQNPMVVTPLPLYHIFALTVNCMAMMTFGAQNLLIPNPRDLDGFVKDLKKYPVQIFTGLNTLFNGLMNHPHFNEISFKELKITVAGGMAMQTAVSERWEKLTGCKISEGYGMTESSPVATCNPIDGSARYGTIGLPLPSTNISIRNEQDEELPNGEVGELCIQGPQVMKGYWKQPEETNKVIYGGWLHSGDMALQTEDGFFKIVDRKKDMILVSGFNVYPNEIEDVLALHDDVAEVAAIGVPDEKSGEVVKIFVVSKNPSLTKEDLITHSKKHLAGYKVPRQVEFREDLPKTNVGKILRRELK